MKLKKIPCVMKIACQFAFTQQWDNVLFVTMVGIFVWVPPYISVPLNVSNGLAIVVFRGVKYLTKKEKREKEKLRRQSTCSLMQAPQVLLFAEGNKPWPCAERERFNRVKHHQQVLRAGGKPSLKRSRSGLR